jgi:hypothetical protein
VCNVCQLTSRSTAEGMRAVQVQKQFYSEVCSYNWARPGWSESTGAMPTHAFICLLMPFGFAPWPHFTYTYGTPIHLTLGFDDGDEGSFRMAIHYSHPAAAVRDCITHILQAVVCRTLASAPAPPLPLC